MHKFHLLSVYVTTRLNTESIRKEVNLSSCLAANTTIHNKNSSGVRSSMKSPDCCEPFLASKCDRVLKMSLWADHRRTRWGRISSVKRSKHRINSFQLACSRTEWYTRNNENSLEGRDQLTSLHVLSPLTSLSSFSFSFVNGPCSTHDLRSIVVSFSLISVFTEVVGFPHVILLDRLISVGMKGIFADHFLYASLKAASSIESFSF